ncbi:MAG TPA: ABC transporter ATP-binding protein/permease [Ideonella sp.]|uniref:ABC transporter ATP-binding protein/permease n=1 Tax=Ideonella sp. TaxID=1929293 RepID=UPI002CB6851C|nr:ABC transporter ATP-binding protein/permease [Ideonella sp.]HSI49808.1 ABC transporter ATP-binding protein/permease [Ideonella sp.]
MKAFEKLALLGTTTRKVWALTRPYFSSEEKWKARLLLAAIIALNLISVYMLVLMNDWNRVFYDALQEKNQAVFWSQLGRFTYLAFGLIVIAVYKFYLTQLLELRWRAWMTTHYLQRWLSGQAFYRMELARFSGQGTTPDNPDQRIQEDLGLFTSYSVSLTMGLLNAVVTLVSFVGILWALSGGFFFSVGGSNYELHGYMVWAAVGYCLVGSVITHFIGRPQIRLNFLQQRYEADFRHHMVRVREYSEAIALDKGEEVERGHLDRRFASVLDNFLKLLKARKNLIWFNTFFGQAAIIFPFIVAAPRYFSGAIQLGELMQISSAFGQVQDSLAWFIDNYSTLASWRATTDRLTSFEDSVAAQARAQRPEVHEGAGELAANDLTLALPDGKVLLSGLSLKVAPGESVLLKGPSGSGKSTLFRAFAGIWPFARGKVDVPADLMCIPQNPYFPDGPLRNALAYPEAAVRYSDEQLRRALDDAQLPQLAARLDDEDAWTQKLSGGERQRLALARVFLKQPSWVLADEATSALDEPAEQSLYERLAAMVRGKGGGLVSIAHRPALDAFHQRRLEIEPSPAGSAAAFRLRQASA